MPLSSYLADAVRLRLATAEVGIYDTPEMQAVANREFGDVLEQFGYEV